MKSGRAVLFPIYKGTFERRLNSPSVRQTWDEVLRPGSGCLPVEPMAGRDLVIQWAKDLRRAIDYLETRKDIDSKRLAYFGRSLGAIWGPVMTAVEPRIKASVLLDSGHAPPQNPVVKESLDWLDRYLGPVDRPEHFADIGH